MNICSVIYFAGTGGNFIRYCLSLSPETVPYLKFDLKTATTDQITQAFNLTTKQRMSIVKFSTVDDFLNLHPPITHDTLLESKYRAPVEPAFYYDNQEVNNYWKWAVVTNHPDNYYKRLPYLKKIIYVDLDLKQYGYWVKKSCEYFKMNFGQYGYISKDESYQLTSVQESYAQQIYQLPNVLCVSMTQMLGSKEGFKNEYHRMCNALDISPVPQAMDYYQEWHHLRVAPFI